MGEVVQIKRKVWVVVQNEATGQYLLARRSKHVNNAGLWNFFGGNVGEGEDLYEAASRELYEESGFRVSELDQLNTLFKRPSLIYFFSCTYRHYKLPSLNYENDSFGWFTRDAAQSLILHQYTRMYFEHLPKAESIQATP